MLTCMNMWITDGLPPRLIFDKTVLIKQLSIVEAHGLMVMRVQKGNIISTEQFTKSCLPASCAMTCSLTLLAYQACCLINLRVRLLFFFVRVWCTGRDCMVYAFRLNDFENDQNDVIKSKADIRNNKLECSKGLLLFLLSITSLISILQYKILINLSENQNCIPYPCRNITFHPGCHTYCLSRLGGSHVHLTIAVNRRLIMLRWKHSAWSAWLPPQPADADSNIIDEFEVTNVCSDTRV